LAERAPRRAARAGEAKYVAPAVLCILRHRNSVLLIEGARRKRWAGMMDGVGGRIQPGESAHRAIVREIYEETGLRLPAESLRLKGVLHSVNFYGRSNLVVLLAGEAPHRRVRASREGRLRWIPLAVLHREARLLPDLYTLIPRLLALRPGQVLSGVAVYDGKGGLVSLDVTMVQT
jgi:8-oxo-dGTP pyrophosphatase MutT (NUDIX family)